MKTKLSIALGSLLGACALHLILTACAATKDSTPSASAQQAPACAKWENGFYLYGVGTDSISNLPTNQVVGTTTLPAGWEPISASPGYGVGTQVGVLVGVRKCAATQ